MEPDVPNSKRKRYEQTLGGLLHPGWRESKRARSVSRSRSPSASGVSTPGEVDTSEPDQPNQKLNLAELLTRPRRTRRANAAGPSANSSRPTSKGLFTENVTKTTQNSRGDARSGLAEGLQKLSIAVDTNCPPLSSAIEDLRSSLHIFTDATSNRQEYKELTAGLESLVQQLISYLRAARSDEIVDAIKGPQNNLFTRAITKEIKSIGVGRSRSGLRWTFSAPTDSEDPLRCYRRIEQLFRQLLGEAIMSTRNIVNKQYINTQLDGLDTAKLAAFDSSLMDEIGRRTCSEHTRTKILQDSVAWTEDPNAPKIYWMNGMAGTGKTTIAFGLCVALNARKQLAASFFCTRTSPECREAKRIVPTIACQFAWFSAPFRSALSNALDENPGIGAKNMSSQFDILLKRPLMKVKDELPNNLVIVVDALDECNDPQTVELFLGLLFRSIVDLPIKFYVTSRPEPAIRNMMMSESEQSRSVLYLHEIERSLVQADIELYLKEELAFISPNESDIKELAEHAGNLFIYAATVVRYIRPPGKRVDSQTRLVTMLAINTKSNKLSGIDYLYSTILDAAINDRELDPQEQNNVRLVLWTAICTCEPVPISTLTALCGLTDTKYTTNALQPLRSVLHVSDRSEHVTTLHASFSDYMFTRERSDGFSCDKAAHSQLLAQQCFNIMHSQLRFNIGSIESSYIPDDKITGLEAQIEARMSEELFYTCRFWADHLSMASPPVNLVDLAHGFLSTRLLFWMEVLNLKKCLNVGPVALSKLNMWLSGLTILGPYSHLLKLVSDAYRFIAGYLSSPISVSTPHIYLSALPLAAPSSLLRKWYLPHFKGLIKVSGSLLERLERSALGTWKSKYPISSAAFSPDGNLIILGTDIGKISVHNAYDGECLFEPFKAHKNFIASIGVLSNGMEIVSGSHDKTLCIWNIQDGSLIFGPLRGHTNRVTSVSFSPDGTWIVSGSDDCTVGVWNRHDAAIPMRTFSGHTQAVKSVCFSPNGTHIISGSADLTIRVWDKSTGTTSLILLGHTKQVTSVQYSADGAHIFSGSEDSTIRVWNASNGSPSRTPLENQYCITSIAVSPGGDCVASGSRDKSVCVWNMYTSDLVTGPLWGHSAVIRSVGFSKDGLRIFSASKDATVRVWNVHGRTEALSKEATQVKRKHIPDIRFAVSPDHTRLACICYSSIEIWNLSTMEIITSIPFQSNSPVECLQFSFDSSRIFILHLAGDLTHQFYSYITDTGEPIGDPHTYSINGRATCSFDGTRVVSHFNRSFNLLDAQSGQPISYSRINTNSISSNKDSGLSIIFSQKSNRFITDITLSEGYIQVWDSDSGTCVAGPFLGGQALDLSPDGTNVLSYNRTTTSSSLHQINVKTGVVTPMTCIHLKQYPRVATFTPDGRHVAFITDGECYVWNISKDTATIIGRTFIDDPKALSYCQDGLSLVYRDSQAEQLYVDLPSHRNTIHSDGWLLDGESRPLFWIPDVLRDVFPRDSGITCEGRGGLFVDYRDMLVGDNWSECYIGDRV
ncbi:hypothetical protein B0J17DRAFT_680375 [Rhizoctonia solani]|nr:hypothetical protein B0J17DRAFT_680375 [Rhizoctonia solani]